MILTDILGDEDHSGDMDFKVTGTEEGVTAVCRWILKSRGSPRKSWGRPWSRPGRAGCPFSNLMEKTIAQPRTSISDYAPKITTIEINPEKIREVIGPGGKVIRAIVSETGAKIEVEDSGKVIIASPDGKSSGAGHCHDQRNRPGSGNRSACIWAKSKRSWTSGPLSRSCPGPRG